MRYVVMGVAGSGKSTIGSTLARALGIDFVEGDDYHSPASVRKMSGGVPLTDADRAAWLDALAGVLGDAARRRSSMVLTCSALKRAYRDRLRVGDARLQFVFLRGIRSVIAERMGTRSSHFMPLSLLDSQFAVLEEPDADERAWVCDVEQSPEAIVEQLVLRATERAGDDR